MNNEIIILITKRTDILIEQTKTKPQETLVYKLNKQMEIFFILPSKNQSEGRKLLYSVTSVGATNFVFNITDENNIFSVSTPKRWFPQRGEEFNNKLNELLELRSPNDIELHVKQVQK